MATPERLRLITHSFDQLTAFERRNYRYFSEADAGLPFSLCRVRYLAKNSPLAPHLHEGLYELVFMLRGEQIYQAEGRNYCLHSGQFFLTPPDLVHSTGGNFEDKALYYYLQADLRQLRRCLNGPLAREAELLAQTARRATDGSRRVFPLPKEAERLLEELLALADEPDPLVRLRTFQKLLQLLLIVCGAIREAPAGDGAEGPGGPQAPGSPEHSAMALAMRYIQAHISEEISVEQLARLCNYSPSTFHAKFKQATGLPPHEYVLRKKIDSACILLATGRYSVREVALRLSFCSEQYFSTVFKKYMSATPGAYRKALSASAEDG